MPVASSTAPGEVDPAPYGPGLLDQQPAATPRTTANAANTTYASRQSA